MSVIDDVVASNAEFARLLFHARHFTPRPRKHLAVITCMDTRLTLAAMGLKDGDAHMIRNAGGIVTEDAIRSLVLSHHLLGTQEVMVINHTDCGLMKMPEEEIHRYLHEHTQTSAPEPASFYAFSDVEANVQVQLQRVREHPWVADMNSRGFVYHVETGMLQEIKTGLR